MDPFPSEMIDVLPADLTRIYDPREQSCLMLTACIADMNYGISVLQSDQYAHSVKVLCFEANYGKWLSLQKWMEAWEPPANGYDSDDETTPEPRFSLDQLGSHYATYKIQVGHVAQLLRDDAMVGCTPLRWGLRSIFWACPQLHTLNFTTSNAIRIRTKHDDMEIPEELVVPFGDADQYCEGYPQLEELILAAHDANFSPRTLRLHLVSYKILLSVKLSLESLDNLFKNVEVFEWKFALPVDAETDEHNREELDTMAQQLDEVASLGDYLFNAKQLKVLDFDLPNHLFWNRLPLLQSFIGDDFYTWPRLAAFSIGAVRTSATDLASFLLRHARTLKAVRLDGLTLTDSDLSWPICFMSFAGRLPELRHFELRNEFSVEVGNSKVLYYDFGNTTDSRGPTPWGKTLSRYVMGSLGARFPEPFHGMQSQYGYGAQNGTQSLQGPVWTWSNERASYERIVDDVLHGYDSQLVSMGGMGNF